MQITVSIRWTVIVNDDIDPLNINAATENIGRDQDALFECFECCVTADPIDIQILRGGMRREIVKIRTVPLVEVQNVC